MRGMAVNALRSWLRYLRSLLGASEVTQPPQGALLGPLVRLDGQSSHLEVVGIWTRERAVSTTPVEPTSWGGSGLFRRQADTVHVAGETLPAATYVTLPLYPRGYLVRKDYSRQMWSLSPALGLIVPLGN